MTGLGNTLPFGLRDVKLYAVDATGTRTGTSVDLPVAKTFSFKEAASAVELKGDDIIVASHTYDQLVEWELEGGGYSLEAYAIMAGGTVTTTGTTPNTIKTYVKNATDNRPYFEVEGQAISDSGGDLHCIVYRCHADGALEGKFENGAFAMTKCTGKAYGHVTDGKLYSFVQNETAVAIP